MFTRTSPLILAAALAGATLTASVAAPVEAAEPAEAPTYFDNGIFHFEVSDETLVTTSRLNAPEGPVDVVTVRIQDPLSGETIGHSFVTITVFHNPIPGEGTPADIARDTIVAGITTALNGASVETQERPITLGGADVDAQRLMILLDGHRASATIGSVEWEDAVIVYADQRQAADAETSEGLSRVGRTLAFGPAPEPEADAPAEDDHAGEEDDGHDHDDNHDDHGH